MSASQFDEFDRRMTRISRRHSKLSHGYVTTINSDGLVVAKPKPKGIRSTLRGLIVVIAVMIVFKAFLHAQLGAFAYQNRVDGLAEGSVFERAGSWIMAIDPITEKLSNQISSLVR